MEDHSSSLESNATDLHKSRRQMYESVDAYRRSFIDASTGLISAEFVESRSCPTCGERTYTQIFTKNGGTYVKCGTCGLIYLNPVFKDDTLLTYYRNNNNSQAIAHDKEHVFYSKIYTLGLKMIEIYKSPGTILDIGCSSGFFLDIAKNASWRTYGIELNRAEVKIAKKRGHTIWEVPIEEINTSTKFDVITLWDVFEHIKNGPEYLAIIKNFLAPSGIIFFQLPNVKALAARIMHERCNMFDGIEHTNLYSPSSFKYLCNKYNFNILAINTIIDELQVINKYLNYDDPYFGETENDTISFINRESINNNLLGYKIQTIITPIGS